MAVICDICDNCHFVYMHACVYAALPCKGVGSKTDSLFQYAYKACSDTGISCYICAWRIIFPYNFHLRFFCFFVLFDCITIFLTGLVGLTANLRVYKERKCSGSFAALNSVCQFIFCIDVISAVVVYICSRKEPVQ